jgi:hypothetical protein
MGRHSDIFWLKPLISPRQNLFGDRETLDRSPLSFHFTRQRTDSEQTAPDPIFLIYFVHICVPWFKVKVDF